MMKLKLYVILVVLCLIPGKWCVADFSTIHPEIQALLLDTNLSALDDIIIAPGDTMFVTGSWAHTGRILAYGGAFIARNADIALEGNIVAMNGGYVEIDSSALTVVQHHIHEHLLGVLDSSIFIISNTTTDWSGYNLHVYGDGSGSRFIWENVVNTGWTSASVHGHTSVVLRNINVAGEWGVEESARLEAENIRSLLVWLTFGADDTVDAELPGLSVEEYTLDSLTPGFGGVPYSISLTDLDTIVWGVFANKGSNVTFRNSIIRGFAIVIEPRDTAFISDVHDFTLYPGFAFPLDDREINLVNTYVVSWNLYPGGFYPDSLSPGSYVQVSNSTLGEFSSWGYSEVFAESTEFDGSGGFIQAFDHSCKTLSNCRIATHVYVRDHALVLLDNCEHVHSEAWATDSSTLIYTNTVMEADPVAYDAGKVWVACIDGPDTGYIEDGVDIQGSAWLESGPLSTVYMAEYRLFYRIDGGTGWDTIVSGEASEVRLGLLAAWETATLSPGIYEIQLEVWDSDGGHIDTRHKIVLAAGSGMDENPLPVSYEMSVDPNPFSDEVTISFKAAINSELSTASSAPLFFGNLLPVKILVYDINGRKVSSLDGLTQTCEGFESSGSSSTSIPSLVWKPDDSLGSGVYFVRMNTVNQSVTRRVVYLK
ncbi:T9SS type A sorting domain-containing protein [bacterium]|nr:T9SS type A sorting domain-containing protein [bacterium]